MPDDKTIAHPGVVLVILSRMYMILPRSVHSQDERQALASVNSLRHKIGKRNLGSRAQF